jgi:hypothetical protein
VDPRDGPSVVSRYACMYGCFWIGLEDGFSPGNGYLSDRDFDVDGTLKNIGDKSDVFLHRG